MEPILVSVTCDTVGDMVDCNGFWSGCQLLHMGFEVKLLLIVKAKVCLVLGIMYDSEGPGILTNLEDSMVASESFLCTFKNINKPEQFNHLKGE